jgi:hypothetical protein
MPKGVIQHMSKIGRLQGAPITLTFGNRHACEIEDNLADLDDHSDNGSYQPSESSDVESEPDKLQSVNDDDSVAAESQDSDKARSVDNDNYDNDSADIDAEAPKSEELDLNESAALDNDNKSVETQEWSRGHHMTTTNPSKTQEWKMSKTQECTNPQNTNGLRRQKRPAESQHQTMTPSPEPGLLQHRNLSIVCLQTWIQTRFLHK